MPTLIPEDVPLDGLLLAYADAGAPDLPSGALVVADRDLKGIADGNLAVACIAGEVVVRRVCRRRGEKVLLAGETGQDWLPQSVLRGRVLRSVMARDLAQ